MTPARSASLMNEFSCSGSRSVQLRMAREPHEDGERRPAAEQQVQRNGHDQAAAGARRRTTGTATSTGTSSRPASGRARTRAGTGPRRPRARSPRATARRRTTRPRNGRHMPVRLGERQVPHAQFVRAAVPASWTKRSVEVDRRRRCACSSASDSGMPPPPQPASRMRPPIVTPCLLEERDDLRAPVVLEQRVVVLGPEPFAGVLPDAIGLSQTHRGQSSLTPRSAGLTR